MDVSELEALERLMPPHKCGLFLTHNEHRDYYQPIAEFIDEQGLDEDEFGSPENRQKCIEADELWVLQWYPDTPIGFYRVAGPSLVDVLNRADPSARP